MDEEENHEIVINTDKRDNVDAIINGTFAR